jgi:hypothetical protein
MRLSRLSLLAVAVYAPQVNSLQPQDASARALLCSHGTSETAAHSVRKGKLYARLVWPSVKEKLMDTYVENTGAAEQEKKIQVVPTENERQIQVPIENADTAGAPLDDTAEWNSEVEKPAQDINIVRAETPEPLGRETAHLPLNEIKAGYGYAFGKSVRKR